jgi:ribosomal protein S18 acetylase RimI-like enzyme
MSTLLIRKASPADAAGIVAVIEVVAAERIHSAIDRAWTVEQETRYLESLSHREALHVALDEKVSIVGFQSLDLWSPVLPSMAHVGQVGTFLLPNWRGRGIGRSLWNATLDFARVAGYRKFAIHVRASNLAAQKFYRGLGFEECGRLTRQVLIDDVEDDEILMEFFFC